MTNPIHPLDQHIVDSAATYTPTRVFPHTHIPGYDSSVEGLCDHLALSHGFGWSSVGVAAAKGMLVKLHVDDHPGGIEVGG